MNLYITYYSDNSLFLSNGACANKLGVDQLFSVPLCLCAKF